MDDYERRRGMSFLQAEGMEPLPTQLKLGEVSSGLKAKIWDEVYLFIQQNSPYLSVTGPADFLFRDFHVNYLHHMADEYRRNIDNVVAVAKPIFTSKDPYRILDATQWMLRHWAIPERFVDRITDAFVGTQAAYRVVNRDTIMPLASAEEAAAVTEAFSQLQESRYSGGRVHLLAAGRELSAGRFAGSVRESAQAIESVARVIEPSGELSKALGALEGKQRLHGALKKGFLAIYGYTSDEKGIRHPLLDNGDAAVDETDALFMLGAASAFITYLIRKNG